MWMCFESHAPEIEALTGGARTGVTAPLIF